MHCVVVDFPMITLVVTLLLTAVCVCMFGGGFVDAALGIDVSEPVSHDHLTCLAASNYSFVVARSHRSVGTVDPNAAATLKAASNAGLKTHAYHFPCVKSWDLGYATSQVVADVTNLKSHGAPFDYLFFDVEPFQGECGWPEYDTAAGCRFLGRMIDTAEQLGLTGRLGVYASKGGWGRTVGANCTVGADHGLVNWYAEWPRPEHAPNFAGWQAFGGWVTPFMHQFNDTTPTCGLGDSADNNWTPYW